MAKAQAQWGLRALLIRKDVKQLLINNRGYFRLRALLIRKDVKLIRNH